MSEQRRALALVFRPLVRATPRFRKETAEMRGITGKCLAPWLRGGDVVWFDSTLEPEDGDLVMASLRYARADAGPRDRDFYVYRDSLKLLRIRKGKRWLVCHEGEIEVDHHGTILGPVTAWHRLGWRRPPMDRIGAAFEEVS